MEYQTKNFDASEFLHSQIAARHGIAMTPPVELVPNLRRLIEHMQNVRDVFGKPVVITSGYRPPRVNEICGGSPHSAHLWGCAADFIVLGVGLYDAARTLADSSLHWRQLILEYPDTGHGWLHFAVPSENIAADPKAWKRQTLTKTTKGYAEGLAL